MSSSAPLVGEKERLSAALPARAPSVRSSAASSLVPADDGRLLFHAASPTSSVTSSAAVGPLSAMERAVPHSPSRPLSWSSPPSASSPRRLPISIDTAAVVAAIAPAASSTSSSSSSSSPSCCSSPCQSPRRRRAAPVEPAPEPGSQATHTEPASQSTLQANRSPPQPPARTHAAAIDHAAASCWSSRSPSPSTPSASAVASAGAPRSGSRPAPPPPLPLQELPSPTPTSPSQSSTPLSSTSSSSTSGSYSSSAYSQSSSSGQSAQQRLYYPPSSSPSSASSSASSSSVPPHTQFGADPLCPLSPASVARLVELASRLSEENVQLKQALSRSTSRRASVGDIGDGLDAVGGSLQAAKMKADVESLQQPPLLMFPLASSSLPPPSHSLSQSAPSSTSEAESSLDAEGEQSSVERLDARKSRRAGERSRRPQPRHYPTMQAGMARRINELRGDALQGLSPLAPNTAAATFSHSTASSSSHSLQPLLAVPSSSSSSSDPADARQVVDRTRSLPLRAVRAQRKTAPADLSAMMEQWRQMQTQTQTAAAASSSAQQPPYRSGAAGRDSGSGRQRVPAASDDAPGCSSSEEDEAEVQRARVEREQSWVRGEATMNHAEVRLMMDMMKAAAAQQKSRSSCLTQPHTPMHAPPGNHEQPP